MKMWPTQSWHFVSAVARFLHLKQHRVGKEYGSIKKPTKTIVVSDLIHVDSGFPNEWETEIFSNQGYIKSEYLGQESISEIIKLVPH